MKIKTVRERLMASTMICGAALMALTVATPAAAQDDTAEVVVTGSRIPQRNLVTTSPITQVTSADVTTQGVTRIEDMVTQLPQAFAAQNSTVANGASGTATVNLRGLGSARTLVLIDGRRLPYGSPISVAADLNQVPTMMVDRVEVLTGGASAVYGSDALAGVVNFIMKKNFSGLELDLQYGFYQHTNDFDGPGNMRQVIAARAATNPANFRLPSDNVVDGFSRQVSLMMGVNSPDDRGNITLYAGWRQNDKVMQADRDYSACSIGAANAASPTPGVAQFTCGGSSTSATGRFTDFATYDFTVGGTPGSPTFVPWSSNFLYNFGPTNHYQRPDERYNLGAFGHYRINDAAEAYTQLMFTDYNTVAQIAPSGNFFSTSSINCDNPMLTATQRTQIGCTAPMIAAGSSVTMYIGRRNVEGGGRQQDLGYRSFRGVVGLRGDFAEVWSYDVSAQYSRVQLNSIYENEFSTTRLNRALDVISVGGTPTCRSVVNGTDPNCVPWNPFRPGGITQAALDYVQVPLVMSGFTTQQVVTAAVNGDLGQYGIQSPAAQSGLRVAFGVEARRDTLSLTPDVTYTSGDGAGQGGPTLPVGGATQVNEVFGEFQLPLVEGAAFAEQISIDGAYRYSEYGTGIATNTWKIGGDWAPTSDIRFRASKSRAVRAPNVVELYTSQGFNLFDLDYDPCDAVGRAAFSAGPVPAACIGANPWQVTNTQSTNGSLNSPAGQYNFLQGGNPNLDAETADTVTLGVVLTPSFIPGLAVSIDWFDIEVTDTISTFGAENALNACYELNLSSFCPLIQRNPGTGQLWIGAGHVRDLNTNIGGLRTTGVDINAGYRFDLDMLGLADAGRASLNFVGTWLERLETDPNPIFPTYDCVGFYASSCGLPTPEWRHRFRATWETPWNADFSLTWRHLGEVQLFGYTPPAAPALTRVDYKLESQNYFDLAGNWQFRDNAKLRFGVNNVFDRDPPLSASVGTTGNGNTYPQLYDAMGRYIFAGVTLNW